MSWFVVDFKLLQLANVNNMAHNIYRELAAIICEYMLIDNAK